MRPGTNCADAPIRIKGRTGWLLDEIGGGFTLLTFTDTPLPASLELGGIACRLLAVGTEVEDIKSRLAERYDGRPGTTYLIRPDQYVAARWRQFDEASIAAALARATGR
ncbi:MAG: hypothetical protein C0605_17520 [Hyphomicrobiales bacterium]|nr:MAG: hypothetical protein C0605_17520 [Hyphomicrobiales bacterium]